MHASQRENENSLRIPIHTHTCGVCCALSCVRHNTHISLYLFLFRAPFIFAFKILYLLLRMFALETIHTRTRCERERECVYTRGKHTRTSASRVQLNALNAAGGDLRECVYARCCCCSSIIMLPNARIRESTCTNTTG